MPPSTLVWDDKSNEVKLDAWRSALITSGGNITKAAKAIGISRRHATNLMNAFQLAEWAGSLRKDAYRRASDMGRPPTSVQPVKAAVAAPAAPAKKKTPGKRR